ncbi:MAG: hypothetical protein K940chlam9_01711 [Chlamydiae bacterium]|nr:hypothetical protein [Chlamydiota bacterium]
MIQIASRLRPFSHLPGIASLIPGTEYVVRGFPALLRVENLEGEVLKEMPVEGEGPFTLQLDLERGCVTYWNSLRRLHILPTLEVVEKKCPPLPETSPHERLSLGSHKKQEWELIRKREDFRDIFPFWFRLGSSFSLPKRDRGDVGMFSLLKECREAIEVHRPERILPAFQRLYRAGFGGMLVPRLQDTDFHGILPPDSPSPGASPLYLLQEGAQLIRSCFLTTKEDMVFILPNLPPEFPSGRFLHLSIDNLGELDLEWTKKQVRQIHLRAREAGEILLDFPSSLRLFRLRTKRGEKGKRLPCGEPFQIEPGTTYFLDQFQK